MATDGIEKDEHLGWACDCPHNQAQCLAIDDDSARALKPACTRPSGHDGPHSYCGKMHPECAWWDRKIGGEHCPRCGKALGGKNSVPCLCPHCGCRVCEGGV